MRAGNSRSVDSPQVDVHKDLEARVARYRANPSLRPAAAHTRAVFERMTDVVQADGRPLILDACCGRAQSSRFLAEANPDCLVVGVDRSEHRLGPDALQNDIYYTGNLLLARANLVDLYALMAADGWRLAAHYMLYPNPYPKPSHLTRRWHAGPSFPAMIALGGLFELRSNWHIYVKEAAAALALYGYDVEVQDYMPDEAITAFEAKYLKSGQLLFRLKVRL